MYILYVVDRMYFERMVWVSEASHKRIVWLKFAIFFVYWLLYRNVYICAYSGWCGEYIIVKEIETHAI